MKNEGGQTDPWVSQSINRCGCRPLQDALVVDVKPEDTSVDMVALVEKISSLQVNHH